MPGRRVGLYIDTRRYRCRNCGKTFYEALPEINRNGSARKELRRGHFNIDQDDRKRRAMNLFQSRKSDSHF